MGTVPVVALGLGSVAGLGAARLVTSHYSVMVEGISHMFIAGPPVVARAGQTVTKDELGGSDIHARAGAVDDVVASEAEAFARARRFLSYLPPSVYELPRRAPRRRDDPARRDPWLIEAVPHDRRKVYDMRRILKCDRRHGLAVRDGPQVRRLGHHRAGAARRLAGRGAGERSLLLRRRLDRGRLAEGRALRRSRQHVPSAGGASGRRAGLRDRRRGREGRHDPPRRARARGDLSGQGAVVLGDHPQGVRRRGRRPHAASRGCTIATHGPRATGARCRSRAASRPPIAPSSTPRRIATSCAHEIEERLNRYRSPFRTAETFLIEEIIDPRDTRPLLCEFANLAAKLREPGPVATPMRP